MLTEPSNTCAVCEHPPSLQGRRMLDVDTDDFVCSEMTTKEEEFAIFTEFEDKEDPSLRAVNEGICVCFYNIIYFYRKEVTFIETSPTPGRFSFWNFKETFHLLRR